MSTIIPDAFASTSCDNRCCIFFPKEVTWALNKSELSKLVEEYHKTNGAAVDGGIPMVAKVSTVKAAVDMGATTSVPGTDKALSDGSKSIQRGVRPSLVAA